MKIDDTVAIKHYNKVVTGKLLHYDDTGYWWVELSKGHTVSVIDETIYPLTDDGLKDLVSEYQAEIDYLERKIKSAKEIWNGSRR
jgi:hypothetical protein